MKNTTIALLLLTFGLQAQTFPGPYCTISNSGTTTEEITSIIFADATITNTNTTSILVDKTASIANVVPGESYTISVKGNTRGNFDNVIVAFVDWNQNNILDNEGEVYEVGTISSSTGLDNVVASFSITVPTTALPGTTRIRISKIYTDEDSPAIINPCAIEMDAFGMGNFPGFGQAIDFTLQIPSLGTAIFDINALAIFPVPTKDVLNIAYKSVMNDVKIYNLLGKEIYSQNINSADAQLNISSLATGIYIVKVTAENAQYTFKIVKE